jgi:outer membrane lipoprotein LolB
MTLADGRRIEAPSLDALLERALGWPLPVERLPAWLDDRFETVLERDTEGQPRLAQDSGWRIEREPRRWALQRSHAGGTLRVVLVLDR